MRYGEAMAAPQGGINLSAEETAGLVLNNLADKIYADNARKGFWNNQDPELELLQKELVVYMNPEHEDDGPGGYDREYFEKVLETLERHQTKLSKGNVGEKLMLICSEIGEAIEAHRKNKMDDHLPERPGLEVELADALIRILDLSSGLGLDIGGAVVEKLKYNRSRPYKHGKAY